MKLKQALKNQNTRYQITTNTLKKYFEDGLIDSLLGVDEMKMNMTVTIFAEGNQVRIQSFEKFGPNGYLDITDPELRKIMADNQSGQHTSN